MIRFLADENLNGYIVAGLRRRLPEVDLVTAGERNLKGLADLDLLNWAAGENRVLLTHDVTTLIHFANERLSLNLAMTGVIEINRQLRTLQFSDAGGGADWHWLRRWRATAAHGISGIGVFTDPVHPVNPVILSKTCSRDRSQLLILAFSSVDEEKGERSVRVVLEAVVHARSPQLAAIIRQPPDESVAGGCFRLWLNPEHAGKKLAPEVGLGASQVFFCRLNRCYCQ